MYLVIDIGGTYIKYGYYQRDGQCIKKGRMKTIKTNKESFYAHLTALIQPSTQAIAISMPGVIDAQKGYIHAITLLPFFNQTNFVKELEERTHLPISIQNDAKCATLGEMWKGSLQNADNALMMVLGTGIGGTCILHGEILETAHHKAGEIGSFLVPVTSGYSNFGRQYNAVKLIHDLSQILQCPSQGEVVFQQIASSSKALSHLQNYCHQLAVMIYNLDYLLDLDIVAIGGGISVQPLFIEMLQTEFQKIRQSYKEDSHEPLICACQFENEANLLGALYHHIKKESLSLTKSHNTTPL